MSKPLEHNPFCGRVRTWITRHWKSGLSRLLLLIGSTVIGLLLAESYLRLFHSVEFLVPAQPMVGDQWRHLLHRASGVPGLDYELVPNMEKEVYGTIVKTNRYGMRDDEPLAEKPENLLRIVALGDSFTFGYRLPVEDAYPQILEKLLNEPPTATGYQYEVLNMAVTGYGTRDEALALKYKGLPWNPDLILIGYVFNDPESDSTQQLNSYFHQPERWESSHLLRLMALTKRRWDIRRLGQGNYLQYLHADKSRHWQVTLQAFEDIRRMAADRNTTVLIVIFPMFPLQDKGWEDYKHHDLHQKVTQAARKMNFQVLDLYDVYKNEDPDAIRFSPSNAHPSPYGNTVAAKAIYEKLMTEHATCFGKKKRPANETPSSPVPGASNENIAITTPPSQSTPTPTQPTTPIAE